jgi:hypothetical protein
MTVLQSRKLSSSLEWLMIPHKEEHVTVRCYCGFWALVFPFRSCSSDYRGTLERYYKSGPSPQWSEHFVSAYASAHPWENWAETWAHYLQMADTLEIAGACGLSLRPQRPDEPALAAADDPVHADLMAFDELTKGGFT